MSYIDFYSKKVHHAFYTYTWVEAHLLFNYVSFATLHFFSIYIYIYRMYQRNYEGGSYAYVGTINNMQYKAMCM